MGGHAHSLVNSDRVILTQAFTKDYKHILNKKDLIKRKITETPLPFNARMLLDDKVKYLFRKDIESTSAVFTHIDGNKRVGYVKKIRPYLATAMFFTPQLKI